MNKKVNLLCVMLLALLTFPSVQINGQQVETDSEGLRLLKKSYEQLDFIDYTSLKRDYLLNKGFFFGQGLEVYKAFSSGDQEKNITFNSPDLFLKHLVCLDRSEWNTDFLISEQAYIAYLKRIEQAENVIPIGILQVEGVWLEGDQVEQNVEAKKQRRVIEEDYEKVTIYSASVLLTTTAIPQVNFVLDEFVYFDKNQGIESIEIDFGDGQGYRIVSKGDRISVDYEVPGEKAIAVKMISAKGEFYNYSTIKVLGLERIVPDEVIDISVEDINGSRGLVGGRADIIIGCDGVFDKPVIFVEGWDALNTNGLSHFTEKGLPEALRDKFEYAGYDVVYLDFSNGGTDIRTNSLVLQRLIRDINIRKIGNEKMTVIGASMGGLVVRHAIRKLEMTNYTHNVGHYISYDSPHRGANIPPGIQTLLLDVNDIFIRDLFGIQQSNIDKALAALNSKAARQMLIRYKGPNPHPDFTQFYTELNNMGFPSQGGIRNIAILNGSGTGARQDPANNFDPGDKLASANAFLGTPLGFIFADIDVWSNQINATDKVSAIRIFFNGIPTTLKSKSFAFDGFNYDMCAGGRLPVGTPSTFGIGTNGLLSYFFNLNNHGRPFITHSPLFSTTASEVTLTTQADLNRSVSFLENNNLTPFDKIYAGNVHTPHTDSREIIPLWDTLLMSEFSIGSLASCGVTVGTMGAASTPVIYGDRFYMCEYDRRVRFWNGDPTTLSGFFSYNWTITGPESFPPESGETIVISYPDPGLYTIKLRRSFISPINGSISAAHTRVVRSYPYWHSQYGCDEDGPIRFTSTENNYPNRSLSAFPNPNRGERLQVTFDLAQGADIELSIFSVDGRTSNRKVLLKGYRAVGNHTESFNIAGLSSGVYILQLNGVNVQEQQKIVVQR